MTLKFVRAKITSPIEPVIAAFVDIAGMSPEASRAEAERLRDLPTYLSTDGRYQVQVRDTDAYVHLSIKRVDREPVRDWRDLQAIKNALVGEQCEAVELFPAENRLVDSANQYHLFAIRDPDYRFPFGFEQRFVMDAGQAPAGLKVRQRAIGAPMAAHDPLDSLMTADEVGGVAIRELVATIKDMRLGRAATKTVTHHTTIDGVAAKIAVSLTVKMGRGAISQEVSPCK